MKHGLELGWTQQKIDLKKTVCKALDAAKIEPGPKWERRTTV